MRLYRVGDIVDDVIQDMVVLSPELYGDCKIQLIPTTETFTSVREFERVATDPNNGVKYSGKWQLIGRTTSRIITIETVTQCKLLIPAPVAPDDDQQSEEKDGEA